MSTPPTPPKGDRIEVACWLAPGLLALLTRIGHLRQARRWRMQVELGDATLNRQMRSLCGVAPGRKRVRPGWLFTVSLPPRLVDAPLGAVALIAGGDRRELSPDSVGGLLAGPQQLGAACRARFDAAVRLELQQFLAASPSEHGIELTAELAANLAAVRDAVREPLPTTEDELEPCSARLEGVAALGERRFWMEGWVHDALPEQIAFTAVSPEGSRCPVAPAAVSFHRRPEDSLPPRSDGRGMTLGYYAYVELEHPSRHPHGWVMEFRTATGREIEHVAPGPASPDGAHVRELLAAQLEVEDPTDAVFARQVLPVMSALHEGPEPRLRRIATFGTVPANPRHSVIVAVGRFDRIDHQLLSFFHDPDFADAELIFVVPPSEEEDLEYLAEGLHELYVMPFVLAIASAPLARARAFNLGASIAHSDVLVLVGGNVFPSSDGWIGRLRDAFDSSASIGVVGATLKHEDGTIAHAGIAYMRGSAGSWRRTLPFAGLDCGLLVGRSPGQVHAVSDACLLIDRGLFERSGGFSELYLDGGDEAGDMCVRLRATAQVWHAPEADVHLLEEDPPAEISRGAARFNEWLFEHRCGSALAAMAAEEPGATNFMRVPELPPIPVYGPAQADPPTEILRLERSQLDKSVLVDAAVQAPTLDQEDSAFLHTYAVAICGWVIPTSGTPATVELYRGSELLDRTVSDSPRPDIGERYPDIQMAGLSGFSFLVNSLTLPHEFELSLVAVSSDGMRAPLATLGGRRRRLASAYRPRLQPLILSTLGRSGSSYLMLLLSQHPEIITMNPLRFEAKLASYYVELLRAVAAPASYGQALHPEISDAHWWLGSRRRPLPAMLRNPGMPRWLGSENIDILAGFCQSRFDGFYLRQAEREQRHEARYFAEKAYPGAVPETIAELYPDGREVVLVRDLRDMFCSIVDYNAKRGFQLWGRDSVETEEEWFEHLRGMTTKLVDAVRTRAERVQIVRYEDLIADPASTLDALLSHLGVSSDPETVRRMLDDAQTRQRPEWERAHQTSVSVASSIGRWKTDLSDERLALCAKAFDDILVEFGYEPTDSPLAPLGQAEIALHDGHRKTVGG